MRNKNTKTPPKLSSHNTDQLRITRSNFRHDWEQQLCFLLGSSPVNREGLPFTTNVTILTSTSQTFFSWVAIFHHRKLTQYARACSSYECGATFMQASRAGIRQETFKIVPQEVLWSIWGSHQTLWSPLSQMLHDILGHEHLQWRPSLISHFNKSWSATELELITVFDVIT